MLNFHLILSLLNRWVVILYDIIQNLIGKNCIDYDIKPYIIAIYIIIDNNLIKKK